MSNKSLLYNAFKSENLKLKVENTNLLKENVKLKDEVASLKFQLFIAKEKIERRNDEIFQLTKDRLIDLTESSPPPTPRKRKRSASDLIESYLASFQDSPYWGDEETKEEVTFDDYPKRKLNFNK